jgi:hypothetical protein
MRSPAELLTDTIAFSGFLACYKFWRSTQEDPTFDPFAELRRMADAVVKLSNPAQLEVPQFKEALAWVRAAPGSIDEAIEQALAARERAEKGTVQ